MFLKSVQYLIIHSSAFSEMEHTSVGTEIKQKAMCYQFLKTASQITPLQTVVT